MSPQLFSEQPLRSGTHLFEMRSLETGETAYLLARFEKRQPWQRWSWAARRWVKRRKSA